MKMNYVAVSDGVVEEFVKTGVNFLNVKRTNFLYKCFFWSFYYLHVTREKLPKQRSYEKFAPIMLLKLTPVLQTHYEKAKKLIEREGCQKLDKIA
jgi:hypothetical protein